MGMISVKKKKKPELKTTLQSDYYMDVSLCVVKVDPGLQRICACSHWLWCNNGPKVRAEN